MLPSKSQKRKEEKEKEKEVVNHPQKLVTQMQMEMSTIMRGTI